jgi:hypothetical protein
LQFNEPGDDEPWPDDGGWPEWTAFLSKLVGKG